MDKYANAQLHVTDVQPKATRGKKVLYKPYQGHWHMPYFADELNWGKNPKIGRIFEYVIL